MIYRCNEIKNKQVIFKKMKAFKFCLWAFLGEILKSEILVLLIRNLPRDKKRDCHSSIYLFYFYNIDKKVLFFNDKKENLDYNAPITKV